MYGQRPQPKLPLIGILGAIGVGIILFALILTTLTLLKPVEQAINEPTAVLTIVAAPSSTPPLQQNLLFTPTSTLQGFNTIVDGIGLDMFVQISGTEGDGLRLRREPGTNSDILFLGYESEVFKVTDGPTEVDGYTWWYLTAPYDSSRSGWAASTFLNIVLLETPEP